MCEDDEREQESKGNEKKMSVDRSRTMWACTTSASTLCLECTSSMTTVSFHVICSKLGVYLCACEKLAMRDAVSRLIRLRAKVVGAEAGGLGVRGEMWGLVSSVAFEGLWAVSILIL